MSDHGWVFELIRALVRAAPWRHLDETMPIDVAVPSRELAAKLYLSREPAGLMLDYDFRQVMVDVSDGVPVIAVIDLGQEPRPPVRDEIMFAIAVMTALTHVDLAGAVRDGLDREIDGVQLSLAPRTNGAPSPRVAPAPRAPRRRSR